MSILNAISFPWFTISSSGGIVQQGEGSLFDLPEAANTPHQRAFYVSIKGEGWTVCPLGYAVYS